MKKYIATLMSACIMLQAHSQRPPQLPLDSMLIKLSIAKEDTNKSKLLVDICQTYWSIDPPEGIKYAEQAIALSTKLDYKQGMANANGVLGMNYSIISIFPKAEEYLQKSMKLSEELNDWNGVGKANGALGNICYFQSKFPQAIEYFVNSMKASERIKDSTAIAASLSNIGAIYMDMEKYPEALDYFQRAVKLNEQTNFKIYLAINLGNIGAIYFNLKDYKKSLDYHLKALNLEKEINEIPAMASTYMNVGSVYFEIGDTTQALAYAKQALQLSKKVQEQTTIGSSYRLIGKIHLAIVQNDNKEQLTTKFSGNKIAWIQSAKNYADSSISVFTQINNANNLKDAYKLLSETQSLLGDNKGALVSFQKYSELKDSIFNTEKDKKLTQISMQYEFEKKETETKAIQKKKDTRQKNIRNSITAGLAGALIFLVVVYRQRNKIKAGKKRSDELLLNILPAEVAEELKSKGEADAKQFDEVTVMFTDFKGFTQISEKLSPKDLVNEIHTCFKAFDEIISKHNIEKIKTIGDAYMCVGGLPFANNTHANDVVNAAMEIIKFMNAHKIERELKNLPVFEIRIGIHTGTVVAGIVGVKKFSYDIWGDTVNVASRMESSGEAGKINISGNTYELIKDKFNFIHRGKIQAKNKGEVDMYFVESKS